MSPIVYQATSTMTESNILRQYNRYMAIDELLNDTSLWGMITEAMLSRYSNDELKAKGSGQTSISNMIERKCLAKFGTIYDTYAINHSVTGKDTSRPLPIVPNAIADDVRDYITSLDF